MEVSLLVGIASILLLGIGAQWLAWRFNLPSILLLLVLGFIAGPVTGIVDRELLQGPWLYPLVSVSVAVILFEGGLSLRLAELREVGVVVRNLVSVGVLVTWLLSAVAAVVLTDFGWSMSMILGSILVVTGPTVIVPLLRHIRPSGRIGTVAKWEGITIDPIGAILAVLVLEFVVLWHEPNGTAAAGGNWMEAILHTLQGLFVAAFVGVVAGVAGAFLLVFILKRRLVPDFLKNPVVLMIVIGVFTVSAPFHQEAGLLATTAMGIAIANQRFISTRAIIEFKEDLRVLLIGLLFIVLSANLELSALSYFTDTGNLLLLAALVIVVRPLAVLVSSLGTRVNWRERAFLAWLAPRGIVAAAVSSLFGLRLQGTGLFAEQAEALAPVVFLMIVGTVAIYGLTVGPLARRLGLAEPSPEGLLFIGAHTWARRMAGLLQEHGYRVLLLDSNPQHIEEAHKEGLPAQQVNVLAEGVMEQLNLTGIGRLLALTSNDEVNSLAALHFAELFESAEVYQLATRGDGRENEGELPEHLRGRPLFGEKTTYVSVTERFEQGARLRILGADGTQNRRHLLKAFSEEVVPLFVERTSGRLDIVADDTTPQLHEGDVVIALVDDGHLPDSEIASRAYGTPPATS